MLSFRKIAIMGRARRWGVVIKVVIAEPVLGRLRIGISPLWDTVNSLVILNRGERAPWPYQAWCRAAATATRRNAGVSLLEWFQYRGGPVSPVLTPNPPSAEPSIEEELEALLRNPPNLSPTDLPGGGLEWFVEAVVDYWRAAIEPYWPAMRAVLQEDLSRRAQLLATQGAHTVMEDLDDRFRWQDNTILFTAQNQTRKVHCTGALSIVSLLFGRAGIRVTTTSGVTAISCQAQGASVLDNQATLPRQVAQVDPVLGDPLAIVVGRSRAAVMRALVVPSTTSNLAAALGLSASTVSEHLSALLAAGVVNRERLGSRVAYSLDRSGWAILSHFGNESRQAVAATATGR
jgi:DNA-binding transcriptional ArsR family regulator